MAFLEEDGTGLALANSYGNETDLDTWILDRNLTVSATTAEKEAALIEATTYLDSKFGDRYVGEREDRDQGLDWPRINAYDRNGNWIEEGGLPRELTNATYELASARLIQAAVLLPDVSAGEAGVSMEADEVGDLKTKREYDGGGGSAEEPRYRIAEGILRPLLHAKQLRRAL